jgi:hypothetical protein
MWTTGFKVNCILAQFCLKTHKGRQQFFCSRRIYQSTFKIAPKHIHYYENAIIFKSLPEIIPASKKKKSNLSF